MKKRPAVLITGGARRVGAALSLYFAQQGYDIALHCNQSASQAKKLQKQIEKSGVICRLYRQDLGSIKHIPALIKKVHKEMPNCRALVNNASIFERSTLMETSEALFDRQMNINFKGPFFLTQAFAGVMGEGVVINMLDTNITKTDGSHFAYLLSKKALAEFTRMAARELGPNIRVNGICPGIMLPSGELDNVYMKKLSQQLPMRKLAALPQVAQTAHWLCENKAITGQIIYVDGGQHLL